MAKVIVYGDINSLTPLYLTVNNNKEVRITRESATTIQVPAGNVYIMATSLSKTQRALMNASSGGVLGGLSVALNAATNDYLEGEVDVDADECLLIRVKMEGLKSVIYNKVVKESQVSNYVSVSDVPDTVDSDHKNKWVVFFLCLFLGTLGVHRFYEKKIRSGLLWLFTFGLFGVGVLIDLIAILMRQD